MDIKIVSVKEGVNFSHDNMPTYQAAVAVDGVKVFTASEDGWGGPLSFSALPGKQGLMDQAFEYAKSLPPEPFNGGFLPMSLESLVNDKVIEFLKNKDLEKVYRKATKQFGFVLFNNRDQSGGDGRPELRFFPGKFKVQGATEALIQAIEKAANKTGTDRTGRAENVVMLRGLSEEHMKSLLKAVTDGDITKQESIEQAAQALSDMDLDPDRIERMTGVQVDNGPRP